MRKETGIRAVAAGFAAFFLGACTPVEEKPQVPEFPRVIREIIPTPTPEKPTVKDIRIVSELFSGCAPDGGLGGIDPPTEKEMWGGWLVKLDRSDTVLKRAKPKIELQTPSGLFIRREDIITIGVSNIWELDYIPAFPGKGERRTGVVLSGKGSQLGQIILNWDNSSPEFSPPDNSPLEYPWRSEFMKTGYLPGSAYRAYLHPNISVPSRRFSVLFENQGERAIDAGVFGFLLSSGGQLMDIFGGGKRVEFGKQVVIEARSVNPGGRCGSVLPDPLGYQLLYWVHFETHTKMPVGKFEQLRLTSW